MTSKKSSAKTPVKPHADATMPFSEFLSKYGFKKGSGKGIGLTLPAVPKTPK